MYKKNTVLNYIVDASETGTGFLVPVFGADFWYVMGISLLVHQRRVEPYVEIASAVLAKARRTEFRH